MVILQTLIETVMLTQVTNRRCNVAGVQAVLFCVYILSLLAECQRLKLLRQEGGGEGGIGQHVRPVTYSSTHDG